MSAITLWRPRSSLLSRRRPLDHFFDYWSYGPSPLWLVPSWQEAPALDVYRENGSVVIKAEVPGVSSADLDITVKENVLTIAGETKAEEEIEEESYVRRERHYGSFTRSVALPADAEGDKAEAGFEDGVLTVTIPVAEEPQPESIKVAVKES